MKTIFCVLLLVAAVYGAEEKKNEKRGVLGLGYGLGGHAPLLGGGFYGGSHGLYGGSHGLGLYNHGVVASAPIVSHSVAAPIYGGHLGLGYGGHLGGLGGLGYGGLGYGGLGHGGLGYGGLGYGGLGHGGLGYGLGHGYLH